jgi:hypothetical protein
MAYDAMFATASRLHTPLLSICYDRPPSSFSPSSSICWSAWWESDRKLRAGEEESTAHGCLSRWEAPASGKREEAAAASVKREDERQAAADTSKQGGRRVFGSGILAALLQVEEGAVGRDEYIFYRGIFVTSHILVPSLNISILQFP